MGKLSVLALVGLIACSSPPPAQTPAQQRQRVTEECQRTRDLDSPPCKLARAYLDDDARRDQGANVEAQEAPDQPQPEPQLESDATAGSAAAVGRDVAENDASAHLDETERALDQQLANIEQDTSAARVQQDVINKTRQQPAKPRSKAQRCLARETALCDQALTRVGVAAAQCSQRMRRDQYERDMAQGVTRQGGAYGGMSCGGRSGFFYPRCIADARKRCGLKPQMSDQDRQAEKLRQMGAK